MIIKNFKSDSTEVQKFVDSVLAECDKDIATWYSNPKRIARYDHCSLCIVDGKPIASSFVEPMGNWWRVGQIHYVLKEYRKDYPSTMLRVGGFLDHHYKTLDGNGIFFSIHVYNRRMKVQAEMMHKRLINTYGKELTTLRDQIIPVGEYTLRGRDVSQEVFAIPKQNFNKDEFLESVL